MTKPEDNEQKYWFHFMRRTSILIATKAWLVIVLSYYAGYFLSLKYYFSMPKIAGLWCAISGILVLQVTIKDSLSAAWLRILGSLIGAATSFIGILALGYHILSLAVCTFFTVILVSLLNIKHTFRLACLTVSVIIIIGMIQTNVSPLMNCLSRFIESAIGSFIAIAITSIFYPLRKKLHLMNK
ncbi:MAG: hypothetical protein A3E82_02820 [Gammaproteobacteria bacterium RIFCSPHIGHO2_12_FULL_38_11]|nr:MAG: hypothetical protein A3E82_02820 [Gammaproteobacteria bacterium RIFCSPHIGHO2_12_FULL_38_11]